jgi:hypothetical protein
MSARKRSRRRRGRPSNQHSRRNGSRQQRQSVAAFWGDPAALPAEQRDVRMTSDPAAVPRSLGPPPLPGHENVAEHYFAAVYDRAVTTAGALAAAGGMIDPEALVDELGQ